MVSTLPYFRKVIVLLVDGLDLNTLQIPSDYTSTPNLLSLAKSGLWYRNVFATGSVTQITMPSVFTGTMPLDHGGYDRGIRDRPTTLAEEYKKQGYSTFGLTKCTAISRFYGYDRGFDDFHELVDIGQHIQQLLKYLFYFHAQLIRRGLISKKTAILNLIPSTEQFFLSINGTFSDITSTYSREKNCAFNLYDKSFLEELLALENKSFVDDKSAYVSKLLIPPHLPQSFRSLGSSRKKPVNDATVINLLIDKLARSPGDMFVYAHLMDIHDFASFDYLNTSLSPRLRKRITKTWESYTSLKHEKPLDMWLAEHYVDHQIGRLVAFLKESNIYKDTLVALLNDHGPITPGVLLTPRTSLHDRILKTNVIFSNPSFDATQNNTLLSSRDTFHLLINRGQYTGVETNTFQIKRGATLESYSYVISEQTGKGSCLLSYRQIELSVRSKQKKIIFVEPFLRFLSPPTILAFDLSDDKHEMNPLSKVAYSRDPEIQSLIEIARTRCLKLRREHKKSHSILRVLFRRFCLVGERLKLDFSSLLKSQNGR